MVSKWLFLAYRQAVLYDFNVFLEILSFSVVLSANNDFCNYNSCVLSHRGVLFR